MRGDDGRLTKPQAQQMKERYQRIDNIVAFPVSYPFRSFR